MCRRLGGYSGRDLNGRHCLFTASLLPSRSEWLGVRNTVFQLEVFLVSCSHVLFQDFSLNEVFVSRSARQEKNKSGSLDQTSRDTSETMTYLELRFHVFWSVRQTSQEPTIKSSVHCFLLSDPSYQLPHILKCNLLLKMGHHWYNMTNCAKAWHWQFEWDS